VKRLVLVGGGHAHALVLREWIENPVPDVELVLVSPTRLAHYSGMVPGWLAGLYDFREVCIDVASLAHAACARFVEDEVTTIDAGQRLIRLRRHDALRFDVASLNIGSTLVPPQGRPGEWLSMRPLFELQAKWDALLARLPRDAHEPRRVVAAGAGPAGVEAVLGVVARMRRHQPRARWDGLLLTRDQDILPTHAPAVRRAAHRVLADAGVAVQRGVDAAAFEPRETDVVLWATGAQAHRWPAASDLDVDAQGFVRIDATLRSVSHPDVFAVGDCASWSTPLPKAGVIPVRQAPVLTRNLRAALAIGDGIPGSPPPALESYRPQQRHLALLATGDGRAIMSWGAFTSTGRWVWRWKDHIDRRFMRRFDMTPAKVA
jgi:pyridine nucleotide-disulfide oxidoreductase family protein